jgi:signal peptidase I
MLRSFLTPKPTKLFFLRLFCVSATTYFIFRFLLLPIYIQGKSMEPTVQDGALHMCWRPQYLFSPPKRFDIVTIRFAGQKVLLLKRIVGLPGETIAYDNGQLYINGVFVPEPHIKIQSSWNLTPRKISADAYYVLGDNRSVPLRQHQFGAVSPNRILGKMIW